MCEYRLADLAITLAGLHQVSDALKFGDRLHDMVCDESYCKDLVSLLVALEVTCKDFQPDTSLRLQITTLRDALNGGAADTRASVIHVQLKSILAGVHKNLESRKFMFMLADQAVYYENALLFGPDFSSAALNGTFSSLALGEMMEAGNCYAAGRYTASVFHCMRVAEYGLRYIAKKTHAKIGDHKKPCPIEYGTWDKVLTAIKNKIADARKLPLGPRKESRLQYFSKTADDCEYLKDIWRNETAHARRRYTWPMHARSGLRENRRAVNH